MISKELENLINAALIDGELTDKEKEVILRKSQEQGVSSTELEDYFKSKNINMKCDSTIRQPYRSAAFSQPSASNKRGSVMRCPACGAILNSFQVQCPKCGYMVDDTSANKSVQEFAEILRKTKNDAEKQTAIETFPIPNTKAVLLEFLTFLRPKIMNFSDSCSSAYFQKYQECIEKARISFSGDKDFQQFFCEYDNDLQKRRSERKYEWLKNHILSILKVIGVVILIAIIVVIVQKIKNKNQDVKIAQAAATAQLLKKQQDSIALEKVAIEQLNNEINESIETEDLSQATMRLLSYKGRFVNIKQKYLKAISKALDINDDVTAKYLLINYPELKEGFYEISHFYTETIERLIGANDYISVAEMLMSYPEDYGDISDYYVTTVNNLLAKDSPMAGKLYSALRREPNIFYEYYIKKGQYEKAYEFFCDLKENSPETYYEYLADCVEDLCSKEKYDEAEAFITKKVAYYSAAKYKGFSKRKVSKQLNEIVENSKPGLLKRVFGKKNTK